MLRFLTLSFFTLLLTSCGFALRGTAELPASLQPLHLDNVNDSTAMGRELMRTLVNNKVKLTDTTGASIYSLALGAETNIERAISVNANARAGEYEIIMTVPFQLKRGNTASIPEQKLSLTKVYLADPENAVAKTEEALIIQNEMRQELSQLILRRLQAFTP
ncbi:MAG: LPS assembly lipoprotein LptE [Gammaproteobacteria bacterium]